MERHYQTTAGIDVHKDTVVVTVLKQVGSREVGKTKTFETFHDSLTQMVTWLREQGVEVVGLESTGVYWMPVVRCIQTQLESATIWVVNPAHIKKVAGRKTDVSDSQWLAKLVMYGLVRPSYLASANQQELRLLTRHRTKMVGDQTRYKNRAVKLLERSGIKLASVCSDPFGKSGRAMIEALLEGKKTPSQIAQLAYRSMKKKAPLIERAVAGGFTPCTAFVLQQLLSRFDAVSLDIEKIDATITTLIGPLSEDLKLLLTVPGFDVVSAVAVLAEIGGDMSLFASADHLASWGGVSPGSEESAGKNRSGKTRKGDKYLRTALVQSAWAATKTKGTFWQQKFNKLLRLGRTKALLAIARRILVATYYILRDRTPYREPVLPPPSPQRTRALTERYRTALEALGYTVSLTAAPTLSPAM